MSGLNKLALNEVQKGRKHTDKPMGKADMDMLEREISIKQPTKAPRNLKK